VKTNKFEPAYEAMKVGHRELCLPNYVLTMEDLDRIYPTTIPKFKTIVSLLNIGHDGSPIPLAQLHRSILQQFVGINLLAQLKESHWMWLLSERMYNLHQITCKVGTSVDQKVKKIFKNAPFLNNLRIINCKEPIKLSLFKSHLSLLESLAVYSVIDENSEAIHDNEDSTQPADGCLFSPGCRILESIRLDNCSTVTDFNFLKYWRVTKELSLRSAPHLTFQVLAPHLAGTLTRLHLTKSLAATDTLLHHLIDNGFRLKVFKVPLAPNSHCGGFSYEALKSFLETPYNNLLEVLKLDGHRCVDSRIWTIRMSCYPTLKKIHVRRTELREMSDISSLLEKPVLAMRMPNEEGSSRNRFASLWRRQRSSDIPRSELGVYMDCDDNERMRNLLEEISNVAVHIS
jgi:hypothetical protein